MAKAHSSRNSLLPGGISRLSRTAVYKKRALYKRKKVAVKKTEDKNKAPEKKSKEPRFYPTVDVKKPLRNRKSPRPSKLRSSLTPGTVVILLAGRHRGKRVVFLKQLPASGLLLVTGPYKVNGVPLRRVPASYVIATQTKIDISKVNLPERVSDSLFKRTQKPKRTSDGMFEESSESYKPSEERKADQQTVDDAILAQISKEANLRKYMSQLFTLRKGQFPHEMVF